MTELEETQKRQLDAAQKLVESYEDQVKRLNAELALSEAKFKALAVKGIVSSSFADLQKAADIYQRKFFWLMTDDSLELYERDSSTKLLKKLSSYTIKSLA